MSRLCANCGSILSENDVFCRACGAQMDLQTAQQNYQEAAQPMPYSYQYNQMSGQPPFTPTPIKKKRTGLILGIASGVITVGLIVVILLVTGVMGGESGVVDTWYSSREPNNDMIAFDSDGSVHFVESDGTVIHSTYELISSETGVILAPGSSLENAEFFIVDGVLYIKDVTYYRSRSDVPYN